MCTSSAPAAGGRTKCKFWERLRGAELSGYLQVVWHGDAVPSLAIGWGSLVSRSLLVSLKCPFASPLLDQDLPTPILPTSTAAILPLTSPAPACLDHPQSFCSQQPCQGHCRSLLTHTCVERLTGLKPAGIWRVSGPNCHSFTDLQTGTALQSAEQAPRPLRCGYSSFSAPLAHVLC